jgi:hypothetical protein
MEYARNSIAGPEAYQAGMRYLYFDSVTVKKGLWRVYGSPVSVYRIQDEFAAMAHLHLMHRQHHGTAQERSSISKATQLVRPTKTFCSIQF